MLALVTFALEMVVCFVMVDFAIEQRWVVAVTALAAATLVSWTSRVGQSKRTYDDLKQGGYGKVVVFKESPLRQLTRPAEVVALLRCKFGAISRSPETASLGHGVVAELGLDPEDVRFCEIKLKEVSRSFAQVITFLPNTPQHPLRLAVGVFYLVLRALDTVEDDMELARFDTYVQDEDKQGVEDARLAAKQRLLRTFAQRAADFVRGGDFARTHQVLEGFGEGQERVLLDNLDRLLCVFSRLPAPLRAVIIDITDEMGRGMADYIARDLKNGTDNADDFERYCHVAAGTVGDGLTRLFAECGAAPASLARRRDLWDAMGSFLQRTNIIRDYLEDMVDGRAWWPRSVWEPYVAQDSNPFNKPALSALAQTRSLDEGRSVRCLNSMVSDTLDLLPACISYLEALSDPSVVSFCALPQVMAIATLAECYSNRLVFLGVVKIRKGLAARIILDLAPTPGQTEADLRRATLTWFRHFLSQICSKAQAESPRSPESERVMQQCIKLRAVVQGSL